MSTRRRRTPRTASLTPLIDVLFILLFASLIQAHGVVEMHSAPATEDESPGDAGMGDALALDAGVPDAGVPDALAITITVASDSNETAHLRRSRISAEKLSRTIVGMDVYTIEVDQLGQVLAVTRLTGGAHPVREPVEHRLLRRVPAAESHAGYEYVGVPGAGVCSLVRDHISVHEDESMRAAIMVVLTVPFVDLPMALARGLKRDLLQCLGDAGGLGMLVQPGDEDDHAIP